MVCDMPKIAARGRELARKNGASRLEFCTEFASCEGYDALLCSGSLHFVEPTLATLLAGISTRPRHLIVNKLPLTQGRPFVTLQNTVYSFNPYKVQNQHEFLDELLALGYEVRDSWENADMSCHIPLHRDRTVERYSGFYLTPRDPRRAPRGSSV
jgi:putative methyltransferase (TIGR04325 family)